MKRLPLFLLALSLAAQDPQTLFQSAMSKMRDAGALAQEGKLGPANELIVAAYAEMDRAIEAAPDSVEFRARRGIAYSYSKTETAIEDLKFASTNPRFGELPEALRQQVARRLAALTGHPDRFPSVAEQTSPIIVAASFTVPPGAPGSVPDWVESTVRSIKGSRGLLGTHAVGSVDHPGMFIVFTWWKDKKAVDDFFYGGLHQSWMRERGLAMTSGRAVPAEQMPSQTAIEIFAGLPGGTQIGGGFIPKAVFDMFKDAK
jgi:heme-degrading monooxygenase HmoA